MNVRENGARIRKPRAPALHQPDRPNDEDAHAEWKQAAPLAGGRTAKAHTGHCKQTVRALFAKTV